jgi:hypothetical protein
LLNKLNKKYGASSFQADIEAQIEQLKKMEKLFLDAVGAKSLEEVNARIEKY